MFPFFFFLHVLMGQNPSKLNPCTHEQYFLLSVKLRPLGNTHLLLPNMAEQQQQVALCKCVL